MTQDKEKRDDIRHKIADAIHLIEVIKKQRDSMVQASRGTPVRPDEHDLAGMKDTARAIGERFIHEMDREGFDPVSLLLNEAQHADDTLTSDKGKTETRLAIECVARAFGLQHQYIARASAIAQQKAASQDNTPPSGQQSAQR